MSDDAQYESDTGVATSEEIHSESGLTDQVMSAADSAVIIAEKEQERKQLQADIDAFLASGGSITSVETNVVADPPKRPQSSYGSQPI